MIDATPLLRLYANRRIARLTRQAPASVQHSTLMRLVTKAATTRFGREHDFSSVRSIADFQRRVPLRDYEEFWNDYWRDAFPRIADTTWPGTIPYFAVTSGTTAGVTKYIPCTRETCRNNTKAAADLLVHHLVNRPRSRVVAGKAFMLGGSSALVTQARGIKSGDLSGIAVNETPWWARPRSFPPRRIALIADWEDKIERLVESAPRQDIRSLSGLPSWLLIFFDKLAARWPDGDQRLRRVFPDLELLVHGGVGFAPYRQRFEALIEGSRAELREAYAASEGFIAVADRAYGDGLRLILDGGLFFEFVPLAELEAANPTRHWIDTVEIDVNYAIVLSSCSGLWAYVLGDTVRFVDLDPPRILVTGRTSYTLSAFGEHLIGEEIEQAVAAAAAAIGAAVTDYAVGPLFPRQPGELGGHLYIVEFARPVAAAGLAQFAAELDRLLRATNQDYDAHRVHGFGLDAPRLHPVEPGVFAAWMKRRGHLGGQHKVPRIVNNQELFRDLRAFAGCQAAQP